MASVLKVFCSTSPVISALQSGEKHRKSELSLYTASLGLIREPLEGPGPVLFIEQQLTMHILCERGREILLCKYM